MKWEKFLGTSQTSKMALHSLTFMVDPTMNLISRPHHEYGRGVSFSVLREYLKISL